MRVALDRRAGDLRRIRSTHSMALMPTRSIDAVIHLMARNPASPAQAYDIGGDIVDLVSAHVEIGHPVVRCL